MTHSFLFASNITDSYDKDLLNNLSNSAKNCYGLSRVCSVVFLSDLNLENINEEDSLRLKAQKLSEADLFLIPAWTSLTDEVKEEIHLAKKQGKRMRIFSHWNKDDLSEVLSFFGIDNELDYLWNVKIFEI